jgi:hypothetical protein
MDSSIEFEESASLDGILFPHIRVNYDLLFRFNVKYLSFLKGIYLVDCYEHFKNCVTIEV